jgi:hypothetical protein
MESFAAYRMPEATTGTHYNREAIRDGAAREVGQVTVARRQFATRFRLSLP